MRTMSTILLAILLAAPAASQDVPIPRPKPERPTDDGSQGHTSTDHDGSA